MFMRRAGRSLFGSLLALIALGSLAVPAGAVPVLQTYIVGSSYDNDTDTWITEDSTFELWVVGNLHFGMIEDVQLAIAHATGETGTITITPTMAGLLTDPSTASTPSLVPGVGADGTTPQMLDGRYLPTHDVYGAGTSFEQYALGDFDLTDSPVGDFINSFPTSFPEDGQINAYTISVTGYSWVHFDTFNHVEGQRRSRFAPFSHDGEGEGGDPDGPPVVPEPATLALLGMGIAGAVAGRRRHRK